VILPTNGKIVVIDDNPEEGLALVKALSRNNISVKYFDGVSVDELPATPLKDVRIVFLDIILGVVASRKTQVSKAVSVLKRILDISRPVPYVLVAWTKDNKLIDPVIAKLKLNKPLIVVDLEKSECKNEDGTYDVDFIERKLNEKCGNFGSLTAFLLWENVVNNCAGEIFNDFTTFYPADKENWDSNLKGVIHGLTEAFVGKDRMKDKAMTDKEKLRNAMFGINGVLIDSLESAVQRNDLFEVGGINSINIADKVKSKINTKMHLIESGENNFPQTGNLYVLKKPSENVINEIVTKNAVPERKEDILASKPKLIELDITPRCDYAQSKRYARLLTGIMLEGNIVGNKYFKKDIELSYRRCPVVTIDGKDCYLLFDYRFFKSLTTDELKARKDKSKYTIRHELVVDIQASFSNHINRFGVTCIE